MDFQTLYSLVMALAALSVASERLVEIIKGSIPYFGQKSDDPYQESLRQAAIQLLAVAAGTLTAYLAKDLLPTAVLGKGEFTRFLLLGIMISGGSGFWNSILSYLVKIKDIKKAKAQALTMLVGSNTALLKGPLSQDIKISDVEGIEPLPLPLPRGVISIKL